jgi:zinc protease
MVLYVHNAPPANHPDSPALDLLTTIMGSGESSRLNERLVRREQAALQVQGFAFQQRGTGAVLALALANQGQTTERLDSLLDSEIERLRSEPVSPEELTKAVNQYRSGAIRQRQTTFGVAEVLQTALRMHGDLEAANRDWERYARVTGEDLQRVARQYLSRDNRFTLVINPPARGTP